MNIDKNDMMALSLRLAEMNSNIRLMTAALLTLAKSQKDSESIDKSFQSSLNFLSRFTADP